MSTNEGTAGLELKRTMSALTAKGSVNFLLLVLKMYIYKISISIFFTVPTKTQLSNFLGTPGEDYFKGNPKSLNFYFLVIWWGKFINSKTSQGSINYQLIPCNLNYLHIEDPSVV